MSTSLLPASLIPTLPHNRVYDLYMTKCSLMKLLCGIACRGQGLCVRPPQQYLLSPRQAETSSLRLKVATQIQGMISLFSSKNCFSLHAHSADTADLMIGLSTGLEACKLYTHVFSVMRGISQTYDRSGRENIYLYFRTSVRLSYLNFLASVDAVCLALCCGFSLVQ